MSKTEEQKHNPWLGLKTYEEEDVVNNGYKFCGREDSVQIFAQMIDYELVATIYGKSGIGKSSLLKAGLFPFIRKMGYSPVWIRLDNGSKQSFAEQAIALLSKYQTNIIDKKDTDASKEEDSKLENQKEASSDDNKITREDTIKKLWDFFHTHTFHCQNDEAKETIPVLVFDQFEEILLQNERRALELLDQLYALISNSYSIPEGYYRDNNFRIVFSLREDYLYLLEEAIDRNNLNLFKRNRFRLRSLEPYQAKSIILEAGEGVIDNNERVAIANKIISHLSNDEEISTQIVSLVCYQLYEKAYKRNPENPVITLDLVDKKEDIDASLSDFYKLRANKLKRNERKYIHRELITNGHRKLILKSIFEKEVSHHQYLMDENIVHEYTPQTNKMPHVEIIHDQLANVIDQEESRINKNQNILITTISLLTALIIAIGWIIYNNQKEKLSCPIVFNTEEHIGKVVAWEGRPYEIAGGHLTLHDCDVMPNAFPNGWDIDTLTLIGDVKLSNNSITNDNIRVLEIVKNDGDPFSLTEGSFVYDSLETIILSCSNIIANTNPKLGLKKLRHFDIKSQNLKVINGTLFGMVEPGIWQVLFSKHSSVYYDSTIMKISNKSGFIQPYKKFDISAKPREESTDKGYYLITSSDSNKTSICKEDLPKGKIIGVDLPEVLVIEDETFLGNLQSCQFISLPKVKTIGKSNFTDWFSELDSLTLPDTFFVHTNNGWINIFVSNQFLNMKKTFGNKYMIGLPDSTIFRWDLAINGFLRMDNNNYTPINHIPNESVGYHYHNGLIVFDSDYVVISAREKQPLLEDSLRDIPHTIVTEISPTLKDYGFYIVINNILFYRPSSETTWKPILTLDNDNPTILDCQPTLREQAFGGSRFILIGPTKYNIPAGDTIIVPYGQTSFYKRLYGNSYTIQELSFHKSRALSEKINTLNRNILEAAYVSDDHHLEIGSKTVAINDSLISEDYFDYPNISSVSIDIRNNRFTKRGNVIYNLRGNAIRSINNNKPIVLDGFQALEQKKIHSGTYILLREDAIFPEPSLIDGEQYTFMVPFGKKDYYNDFANNDNIEIIEMGRVRSLGWRIWKWANKVHRITIPDRNIYIWSWKSDVFIWIGYAFLTVFCSLGASRLLRRRKWFFLTLIGLASIIPICHYFTSFPTPIFNALISFTCFTILAAILICLLHFRKHNIPLVLIVPLVLTLASCNKVFTDCGDLAFIPVKKGNCYGVVNREGKQIVPIDYEYVWMENTNVIRVQNGTHCGIYDTLGRLLLPCRFERVESFAFMDNVAYFCVTSNNKHGVVNSNREIVVPFQNDIIDLIETDGQLLFRTNGYKYYNTNNELTLDLSHYSYINKVTIDDKTYLIVTKDNKQGVIDFSGQYIIDPVFTSIQHIQLGDEICLIAMDTCGNSGVINYNKDTLIAFQKCTISYHDNTHLLITYDNGQLCASDLTHTWDLSNVSLPYHYSSLTDTSCFFTFNNGKEGLVDIYNNVLIPFKYDTIKSFFNHGFYLAKNDGEWTLLDKDGKSLFVDHYDSIKLFTNNRESNPLIAAKKDGCWGVVNCDDQVIVPFRYNTINNEFGFNNTLFFTLTDSNVNTIAVNYKGDIIIPPQKDNIIDNRGFILFVRKKENDYYHKKNRFDAYLPNGKIIKKLCRERTYTSFPHPNRKYYECVGKKHYFGGMRHWIIDDKGTIIAKNCNNVHYWTNDGKAILVVQKGRRFFTLPLT